MEFFKNKKLLKVVLIVIFYSLIPLFFLSYFISLGEKERLINFNKEIKKNIIQLIIENEKQILVKTEIYLKLLSELKEVKNLDKNVCQNLLSDLIRKSDYINFFLFDNSGKLVCSVIPLRREDMIIVSDRDYYKKLLTYRNFIIGNYQIGRVSKKPIIVAAYPIMQENTMIGGIGVSLSLEYLSKYLSQFILPKDTIVKIIDKKGYVLAINSNTDLIGKNVLNEKETAYIFKNKDLEGFFEIDNHHTYYFKKIKISPFEDEKIFIVEIPKNVITAPAEEIFKNNLRVIIVFSIITIFITYFSYRFFIYKQN